MTKLNIRTLGELVEKDTKKTGDVKRMIDRYGVYYRNRWHEWEAAPKDASNSESMIDAAISALGSYADIFDPRAPMEAAEEFYSNPNTHDIYRFGFNQNETGDMFVEKTLIQTLEEQIERLKEENRRLDGVYEASTDNKLVAPHLELANQIYREALKKLDSKTSRVEGKTPNKWMKDRLAEMDLNLSDSMIKTIAAVANWSKEQTNKPKS